MFTIFRRIANGEPPTDEFIEVATIADRIAAENLVHSLDNFWPAEYIIRETERKPN